MQKNILPLRNGFWIGIYILCVSLYCRFLKPSDLTFPSPLGQFGDRSTKCPAVFKGYSWSFLMFIIPLQKYVKLVSDSLFLHNNNPLTINLKPTTGYSWSFLMFIIPLQKYVKLVSNSLFLHNNNPLTINLNLKPTSNERRLSAQRNCAVDSYLLDSFNFCLSSQTRS